MRLGLGGGLSGVSGEFLGKKRGNQGSALTFLILVIIVVVLTPLPPLLLLLLLCLLLPPPLLLLRLPLLLQECGDMHTQPPGPRIHPHASRSFRDGETTA